MPEGLPTKRSTQNGDRRPCRRCGASLIFLKNATTKALIPCIEVKQLYVAGMDLAGEPFVQSMTEKGPWYISHFLTCPNADEFSRKGNK